MTDASSNCKAQDLVRARLIITGMVQGVCYRANAVDVAADNGVAGWVKNKPDGSVEAVLEGSRDCVTKVIEWCRLGPPKARVDKVEVCWEVYKNEFDGFTALTRHNNY